MLSVFAKADKTRIVNKSLNAQELRDSCHGDRVFGPRHNKGLACSMPPRERHSLSHETQARLVRRREGMRRAIRQMAVSHMKTQVFLSHKVI